MSVEQLILDKLQQISEPQRYAVLQYVEQLLVSFPSTRPSIRDNPAFGMWADRKENTRDLLNQMREQQWINYD
jgi:hypothetical protein